MAAKKATVGGKRRTRPKAAVDPDSCSGCEICIALCPRSGIVKIPGPLFATVNTVCEVDRDRCTGCALCARSCPWEAITMVHPSPERG